MTYAENLPTPPMPTARGALTGYRILDLADESGAFGTKVLADLGAEVIKLEPPEGCRMRRLSPMVSTHDGAKTSLYFAHMNTNKQSVTLSLETAEGQALFRRLAVRCDAIFVTAQPGFMSERRIGIEHISRLAPRLVWVSLTPFGLTGPRRHRKGSSLTAWASSGVLNTNGFPGKPPSAPGGSLMLGNTLGALSAAAGCLLALRARDFTGQGQLVDVSLQEAAMTALAESNVPAFLDDLIPRVRLGNRRPFFVPVGLFPCQDGHVKIAIFQPGHWPILARWIEEKTGNAATDPILNDRMMRLQVRDTVEQWTESLTLQYTKQEFFQEGQRRGLAVSPVNTVADLSHDPHLAARDFWSEMVHAELGRVRMAGAPYRFSETPWRAGRAPLLGEHNEAVYCQELALSQSELDSLIERGVI